MGLAAAPTNVLRGGAGGGRCVCFFECPARCRCCRQSEAQLLHSPFIRQVKGCVTALHLTSCSLQLQCVGIGWRFGFLHGQVVAVVGVSCEVP